MFIPLPVSHWSCVTGYHVGDTLCFDVLNELKRLG